MERFKSRYILTNLSFGYNFELVDVIKKEVLQKCLMKASEKYNKLKIQQVFINTTKPITAEIFDNEYLRDKYFQLKSDNNSYIEVVIDAW